MTGRATAFFRTAGFLLFLTGSAPSPKAASADLFDPGRSVPAIGVELTEESAASLRRSPRTRVPATLRIDSGETLAVRVRVKGSTGSFRPFDDRPSLTVDAEEPARAGFERLHLNNAAEDPTRLREWLGHRIGVAAGVPSPRVAHGSLRLGTRDLGLYVLVEGGTAGWLRTAYPGTSGTLFEPPARGSEPGVFRRVGSAGDDRRLRPPEAFLAGVGTSSPDAWTALSPHVDESAFLDFLALEILTGHPDGYAFARNNYRLWIPADGSRIRWVPHGSDRLFTAPGLPWPPHFAGTAAAAFVGNRGGLERLRERILARYDAVADAASPATLAAVQERLAATWDASDRTRWREDCAELGRQIRERLETVRRQLAEAEPWKLAPGETTGIRDWTAEPATDGVELATIRNPDGGRRLLLRAEATALAGWAWTGSLPPGRYRFSGAVRLEAFQALPFGREGGAFLEAEPDPGARTWLRRTSEREEVLQVEFAVRAGSAPTRLRAGFRGASGRVEFDLESLRLRRLE